MRRFLFWCSTLTFLFLATVDQHASVPLSSSPEALEQRVADLEAYLNNASRINPANKLTGVGPGHTGWLMTSTALVLFMCLPGLALFYGGLVRRKNVLSILAQCLAITGVVSILWWAVGYSLSFSKGNPFFGNLDFAFLRGVDSTPNTDYGAWVPHSIFAMFQMMFAIITPALIIGAVAERMKFSAILLFVVIWMFAVYFPLTHMMWGADGWMNGLWNDQAKIKAIDFAGGIVVHMTSGWSALVLCILLGKRLGYGKHPIPPHSMVLCMIGTGMLWVGWYGFNAGSAIAADNIAANAFVTTTLAAAVGGFTWGLIELVLKGKPSVLGLCSGTIGGLATITPACGFISPAWAVALGIVGGTSTYWACTQLKTLLGYDDALDTFGVHAVGGTLGSLLAGLLASQQINANLGADRIKDFVGTTLWWEQLKAMGITLVWSVVATILIAYLVKAIVGDLRVKEDDERAGLDLTEHGEEGYQA